MANQTMTVETVTVIRPVKAMAFACGCVSLILHIVTIASTAWLTADDDYRQGLWEECSKPSADAEWTCSKNTADVGGAAISGWPWISACAALTILSLLLTLAGTVLTGVGLITKTTRKLTLYRAAIAGHALAAVCLLVALVVFPIMFMQEINERGKEQWWFDWSYGVGWGAWVFILGAIALLAIDKENDQVYYREKMYYDNSQA